MKVDSEDQSAAYRIFSDENLCMSIKDVETSRVEWAFTLFKFEQQICEVFKSQLEIILGDGFLKGFDNVMNKPVIYRLSSTLRLGINKELYKELFVIKSRNNDVTPDMSDMSWSILLS